MEIITESDGSRWVDYNDVKKLCGDIMEICIKMDGDICLHMIHEEVKNKWQELCDYKDPEINRQPE